MQIQILSKAHTQEQGKTGMYGLLTLTYKRDNGKTETKKIFSFAKPATVYETLRNSEEGQCFQVEQEKDAKGYLVWTTLTNIPALSQTAAPSRPGVSGGASRGFETPEERAARQVYIVRQSSLERALQYFEVTKNPKIAPQDVIGLAKTFEQYVFGESLKELAKTNVDSIENLQDDLPF